MKKMENKIKWKLMPNKIKWKFISIFNSHNRYMIVNEHDRVIAYCDKFKKLLFWNVYHVRIAIPIKARPGVMYYTKSKSIVNRFIKICMAQEIPE